MGSPCRNLEISETTEPILLKFTEHIGPDMVFWSVKYHDRGLKFNGDRQQTKFTFQFSEIRISNNFEDKILKKSSE